MGADLDVTEVYVSIKNGLTKLPYIADNGQTSLAIPFESCDWTEIMYEAKVTEVSTAKIVLPSLLAFPELRALLQKIQEGDRVEIFAFQPDCGDPVIAGNVPPNGITEADGKTTLDVKDTLGQLTWQKLRKYEYLIGNASQLYDRARSIWLDLVNEDFRDSTVQADYGIGPAPFPNIFWGAGYLKTTNNVTPGSSIYVNPNYLQGGSGPLLKVSPGDSYLMECDLTMNSAFTPAFAFCQIALMLQNMTNSTINATRVGGFINYLYSTVAAFPDQQQIDCQIYPTGGLASYDPGIATTGTNLVSMAMPQTHHFAVFVHFNFDGTVSVYVYLDQINMALRTQPWNFDSTGFVPLLIIQPGQTSTDYSQVQSWRVRKLNPVLLRAGRFNPQTTDALSYQPNNEDNLQFLQLIAEKDSAEYRPIYHAWPKMDELELDAVNTLGKFASRTLDYEQPPALPTEGSPQASPLPVVTDLASFLVAPPFRFEEGYNLGAAPKVLAKANAHANDVIRVGASSIDSQVWGEKWSVTETGRPQHSPSGAQYPYFEQITNDDRVGIQSLVAALAGLELARRIDPTPSLEIDYVEELPWAFRWRAGDQVFTKTLSLRTNIEQELRAQKVQYKAGSPIRTVTLGRTDWDPSNQRLLMESMKISWLYEQSGSNPGIYVYPSLGNINSGATSAIFSIPLDQYTTGSAIVAAWIHWFADANVMNIQPVVNGTPVYTTGIVGASGTESGLILATQYFQRPGTYQLAFKNNDAATRNLTGAFLVLRIKG